MAADVGGRDHTIYRQDPANIRPRYEYTVDIRSTYSQYTAIILIYGHISPSILVYEDYRFDGLVGALELRDVAADVGGRDRRPARVLNWKLLSFS